MFGETTTTHTIVTTTEVAMSSLFNVFATSVSTVFDFFTLSNSLKMRGKTAVVVVVVAVVFRGKITYFSLATSAAAHVVV